MAGVPLRSDSDTAPLVRAQYLDWLSQPDSFAFFAEVDGRAVGYIIGFVQEPSEIWDTGLIGHIDSFLVLSEMRGRGIGRLLMEAAYDHMRRVGVGTVGLEVSPVTKQRVAFVTIRNHSEPSSHVPKGSRFT
jgi:GNAT superfamily N-acetyltransferase